MAGNYKVIATDDMFQPELLSAGTKLVVVDFFATWCGPCQRISPVFEQLAAKYPRAMFLKVDVEKCQMDLTTFYQKTGCECLNESNEHPLSGALNGKTGYLESDCDEQLLITLTFNQLIKLHSIRLRGPADQGPKTVKIFINQPKSLDFDSAESMAAVQTLEFSTDDVLNAAVLPLLYVKFQNVSSVTLFVKDNHAGTETTRIDQITLFGSPVAATNMAEFKRVAGKKGEAH